MEGVFKSEDEFDFGVEMDIIEDEEGDTGERNDGGKEEIDERDGDEKDIGDDDE